MRTTVHRHPAPEHPATGPEHPAARLATATAFLALVAWLGGCQAGNDSGNGATIVRDTLPSGIPRVVSVPTVQPGWTLQEELRVGTIGDGGPDSFAQIKGLAVLADGGFAVLEAQASELRVFGPDGSHLATHGRQGQGPGEMESPNGLMLAPDGRLWVPDPNGQRMSIFDPVAGFVESVRWETSTLHWLWPGKMTANGRIVYPDSEGSGDQSRNVFRIYDASMTVVETLPRPGRGIVDYLNQPSAFCWSFPGGGMGCAGIPWYPYGVTHVDPSGVVWSNTGGDPAYRLRKWTPGGDTALVSVVDRQSVPVSVAERDSVIAQIGERAPEHADLDWSRIPEEKPVVLGISTSAEGNLWVRTRLPDAESAFDVLAPDGSLLRTVVSPLTIARGIDPVVRSDHFWAVVADDLGVQYVVRAWVAQAAPQD